MKKYFTATLILTAILAGCGDGGSGTGEVVTAPSNKAFTAPVISGDDNGYVDHYLVAVGGILETTICPLGYATENLAEGVYKVQIRAVFNGEVDHPVNFTLLVVEYDITTVYEIVPDEGYESFFDEPLIYEIKKKKEI